MARNRIYNEPKKLTDAQKLRQQIFNLVASGVSKKNVAIRLGITSDDFDVLLSYKESGVQPYQIAFDAGLAQFESENIDVLEEIMDNPETSDAIKMKIARDNLKTLEQWAVANKNVKVQVSDGQPLLDFEPLTAEEQEQIKNAHKSVDSDDDQI